MGRMFVILYRIIIIHSFQLTSHVEVVAVEVRLVSEKVI